MSAKAALALIVLVLGVVAVAGGSVGDLEPAEAAFPGENGKIAFGRGAEIWVMDGDGSHQTALVLGTHPAWSSDGSQIAYTQFGPVGSDIWVMNADGSDQMQLTDNAEPWGRPTWSPDGTRIAFGGALGNDNLWVMNADGSGQTILTEVCCVDADPSWSPDGSRIAFARKSDSDPGIWVMNPDGSNQINLTSGYDSAFGPSWSPDGSQIAFWAIRDSIFFDIYVIDADGSGLTRLTTDDALNDKSPAWSPDGTQIVFEREEDLYVMNADGSGLAELKGGGNEPDWQPLPVIGDVDCNNETDSVDAALILQFDVELIANLACPQNGDLSGDGTINSIDAAIVLQCDAGLFDCASLAGRHG